MPLPPLMPGLDGWLPPETTHAAIGIAVALHTLVNAQGATAPPAVALDVIFREEVHPLAPMLLDASLAGLRAA